MVVPFEEGGTETPEVSMNDLNSLLAKLKSAMTDSYESFRLEEDLSIDSDKNACSLNLDTLMIPCTFKPTVGGNFEKNISLINIQLGKFASLKTCSSVSSFEKFLDKKLEMFCDEYQSRRDFMGKKRA